MPWSFRDYLDDRGRNLVERWFNNLDPATRAALNVHLKYYSRLQNLAPPHYRPFSGRWSGIGEIRIKANKVAYRLLACRGPGNGEMTILLPTSKKKSDVANDEKDKALQRKKIVSSDRERTSEHNFEK